MSKKLHNFDLKGIHWSTLGRPRGSGHSYNEATSGDSSTFVFKAERDNEISPSKLAESFRDLRIPRGKVLDLRSAKGKQVRNDDLPYPGEDVIKGARLLTNQSESKNVSDKAEEDSDDVILTKLSGTAVHTSGSVSSHGGKRWNLRNRKLSGLSKGAGSSNRSAGSSTAGPNKGKKKLEMPSFPTFSRSVTKEEAMEDLAKILGRPPPKKVKKRPRKLQRQIDLLVPGSTLEGITLDRYDVQEKHPTRKGK